MKEHEQTQKVFRPETNSRQLEIILWSALGLFIGLVIFVPNYLQGMSLWSWLLVTFFAVGAASVSLTNWKDRKTKLVLDEHGIVHSNPLRTVKMDWHEVTRLTVYPGKINDKIVVQGKKSGFYIESLGELKVKGEVKDSTGFRDSQKILDVILNKTGLNTVPRTEMNNYYYFSKE